jgi:hypothetical protein
VPLVFFQEDVMENWPWLMIGKRTFGAPSARGYLPPRSATCGVNFTSNNDPGALSRRRGEALRGFYPKLANWLETRTEQARRREVEAFLSQATDIADLEQRILRVQRRARPSLCC